MEQQICFKRFGTMVDCSRNGVMSVKGVKRWIDVTADLGYNTLLLYTEDTYEVDDNPYFGYMRGRYTQEELKELDAYACSKGMELIPCIQTLAHLNAIVRWPAYSPHVDTGDILLAGDEAVYELIDKMFASISKCFTSRTINIGMDEAMLIGRGQYYNLHGDTNRFQILVDHVNRVAQIGKKYGFIVAMWSDMFYRLAAGNEYYNSKVTITEEIKQQIPDNVQLIYWDYYHKDKKHYDRMIESHAKLKEDTWFAGGLWSWVGFAPHNGYSMKTTVGAIKSCVEHQVQDVFLTMWGDDGGECSKFALLPSLFYASELARGNYSLKSVKEKFQKKYGISYDRFMMLDLVGTPGGNPKRILNPEKYLLYNDPFTGLMDCTLSGEEGKQYASCARKLGLLKKDETWGYLFATQQALCDVLAIKADLGARTRAAYESRDPEVLTALISDYKKLLKKLQVFYKIYKEQWFKENKPHGFDVQDIRLGGLMKRVESCMERLQDLADGKISVIEELEEKQLDIEGAGEAFSKDHTLLHVWGKIASTNVISW